MPRPALGGLRRLRPEHERFELWDEQLVETDPATGLPIIDPATGKPKLRPLVVYLRALLPQERDAIAEEAAPFVARFVTGGWVDAADNFRKERERIVIDDLPVPIDATFVRKLFRYMAMQKPAPGKSLPGDADPLDFAYMVEMTVTLLDAWPALEQAASKVWVDGVSGKAYGMMNSDERPDDSSQAGETIPSPTSTYAPESTTSVVPSG